MRSVRCESSACTLVRPPLRSLQMTGNNRPTLANASAFVLALTASVLLLVVPVYKSVGSSAVVHGSTSFPREATKSSEATLLEQNGPSVLVALIAPVLITLMPLLVRRSVRRPWFLASAITLTFLCILAGFSIGLLYLPAAVALWIATAVSRRADTSVESSAKR